MERNVVSLKLVAERPVLAWLGVSAAVIVLDQATKALAERCLELYQPVAVLPFFNLTLLYNRGAAFSLLSQASGWQRWFFIGLAVAIVLFLVRWLSRLPSHQYWTALGISLILGGAIGNLIDRIWHGHVIDFIQLYYKQWYWPAFNVADSAISVGVVLLILDTWWGDRQIEREEAK